MGNPFAAAMGGSQGRGGTMNMMQAFQQFMGQMRGKDPTEMLNQMVSSGKVSQQQLNQAQQMAKQMEGPLGALKGMFGFN